MNNLERFKKALNWEPVDRILTYDYVDSGPLIEQLGGYQTGRPYTWEELLEVNALSWKNAGLMFLMSATFSFSEFFLMPEILLHAYSLSK